MRKAFFILLCISMLMMFVGCGETTTPEKVNKDVEATEKQESKTEIFKIGETAKMGDLEFTVNSARWNNGNEFLSPEEGEKWLTIDATVENNAKESASISSMLMFNLQDTDGYNKDLAITPDDKGSLDGEVGPGRKLRGEISFSVGAEQTEWDFIFEPNVFGFGQAIYKITADEVQ